MAVAGRDTPAPRGCGETSRNRFSLKAYFSLKQFDLAGGFQHLAVQDYRERVLRILLRKKKVRPLVYESDLSEEQAQQVLASGKKGSSGPDISEGSQRGSEWSDLLGRA